MTIGLNCIYIGLYFDLKNLLAFYARKKNEV